MTRIERSPVCCEFCHESVWVKPNGDCPVCGRLLTGFPGLHMKVKTAGELKPGDRMAGIYFGHKFAGTVTASELRRGGQLSNLHVRPDAPFNVFGAFRTELLMVVPSEWPADDLRDGDPMVLEDQVEPKPPTPKPIGPAVMALTVAIPETGNGGASC